MSSVISTVTSLFGGDSGGGGGLTDSGWVKSTTLQKFAAVSIATINTVAAVKIAKQQYDIAERRVEMDELTHSMLEDHYFPCEIKALKEACDKEEATPQYEEQSGRFANSVSLQFARVRSTLQENFSPYCRTAQIYLDKMLAIDEATAVSAAINYGYRYAEARADALNDVRWSRRFSMLQHGRGLSSQAISNATAASNMYSSLGTDASKYAGKAFQRLEYLGKRNAPIPVPNYLPYNGGGFQMQTPGFNAYPYGGQGQAAYRSNFSYADNFMQSGFNGGTLLNSGNDQSSIFGWDYGGTVNVSGNVATSSSSGLASAAAAMAGG